MNYVVHELFDLVLRWSHVLTAMLWVGQIAHLVGTVEPSAHPGGPGGPGSVAAPDRPPSRAVPIAAWTTGFLLLGLLYHHGGGLLGPRPSLSRWIGIGVSLAVLPAGWVGYELLWSGPLRRFPRIAALASLTGLVALVHVLHAVFAPRAAVLHAGAVLASVMLGNVLVHIRPASRRVVEGDDPATAEVLRTRARHNLALTVPVLFAMTSGHYPVTTYGRPESAWIVSGLLTVGLGLGLLLVRHVRRTRASPTS